MTASEEFFQKTAFTLFYHGLGRSGTNDHGGKYLSTHDSYRNYKKNCFIFY